MRRKSLAFLLLLIISLAIGCVVAPSTEESKDAAKRKEAASDKPLDSASALPQAQAPTEAPRYSGPIQFSDVSAQAGLNFKHNSGAFGKKYLPETLGSGCAFIDYDNDGWQDILLVNSMNWPGHAGTKSFPALYHNNRNGSFADVTKDAGLAVEMYGLGCAVADYDNDGFDDIYLTCLGANHLFRNLGSGKFQDVTARAE